MLKLRPQNDINTTENHKNFSILKNPVREGIKFNFENLERLIKKYEKQMSRKRLIGEFLKIHGLDHEATRLESCGLNFKRYKCDCCQKLTITHTDSCNLRICSDCCKKQYWRHKKRIWGIIERYAIPQGQYRKKMLREITLTWKQDIQDADPKTLIDTRRKQMNKFLNYFRSSSTRGNKRKKRIFGSFKVFETARSSKNFSRIHIHAHILVISNYIPQKELSKKWNEISGNPIVWITNRTAEHGLSYLLKHIYKPPKILPSDMPLFLKIYKNRRQVTSSGEFFRIDRLTCNMEITLPLTCWNCGNELMNYDVKSFYRLIWEDFRKVG